MKEHEDSGTSREVLASPKKGEFLRFLFIGGYLRSGLPATQALRAETTMHLR